jgi:hypothetical protein
MDNIEDLDYTFDDDSQDVEVNPSDLENTFLWGVDWTTETIINQIEKKNIDLDPAFQRRDAWNDKMRSSFIESILLGVPIPQIVLAERNTEKGSSYIVLDGKQRLTSVMKFRQASSDYESFKLGQLDVLKNLNGKTYNTLPDKERNIFDNRTIRAVVIRGWTSESTLYTIFLRLNVGSLTLSPQELRKALHPGPFVDYIDELSIKMNSYQYLLGKNSPDNRMRDTELLLRIFGYKFNIDNYHGNLKVFLDDTCKKLNDSWEQQRGEIQEFGNNFSSSVDFLKELLQSDQDLFKASRSFVTNPRLNKAIFEVLAYNFTSKNIINLVNAQRDLFIKEFEKLKSTEEFNYSINNTTKETGRLKTRFTLFAQMVDKISSSSEATKNLPAFKY